ncbi:glycine betaine/L-proline ABC transporter substrate-binding protein ProX [Pseudomonas putida]|uniref:glycine betaine/L-proline ABC transporter substrate-binding protein ProX n=2 Tax=Pseudomonas putida TaxID=303 RepID=UPI0022DE19A1|nr:glycine betaine/L-proline ABC transporter substrate-binding protein ProX [Pseudomonas putida]
MTIPCAPKKLISSAFTATLAMASLHAGASPSIDKPGDGVKITPIFSSIAEERFRGEIAMEGLRQLGYNVQEPEETEYSVMMVALANGDADFSVHLWDRLHDSFYQQAGGDRDMVKGGVVMPDVKQGYQIDKKTADAYHIKSLTDLKRPEIAKLFDSDGDGKADLTGCNPGWGCELIIDRHMKSYALGNTVHVNQGSYFALMADTVTRYNEGKPVLFFTWVPQWLSSVLLADKDVVWLEIPPAENQAAGDKSNHPEDKIETVLNREFAQKNPAALKFLSEMQISAADESAQNFKMHEGERKEEDITRHAMEWISFHQDEFNKWLNDSKAAASVSSL